MNDGKIFLYNAHWTALGGIIRRPFSEVIQSQAATSLPVTGGYGAARVSNFKFHELITFREAYTQVAGSQNPNDGSYSTLVSSVVEGLDIDHLVTADRIVARLATKHGGGDEETSVTPFGCQFVNLRVGGYPVVPELDLGLFSELDTSRKFKERHKKDKAFRKEMHARCLWGNVDKSAPEILRQRYKWDADTLPESKGIIPCTLVKSIRHESGLKTFGNVIVVPNFGIIYLAEYEVKESARRLTMMRLEMGSPQDGSVGVGGVDGNGTMFP